MKYGNQRHHFQGVASSIGRIKLPERRARMPNGVNAYIGQNQYMALSQNKVKIPIMCTFDGAVVLHLDENGLNNKPENLRWGTQKESLNAPGFIEYCKSRTWSITQLQRQEDREVQNDDI